jgi:purine-binding chemotaxis protein CheW
VQYTPVTVIIVVSVMSSKGPRDFGLVVDGVSDVINISTADVKPAPELGTGAAESCVRGLVAVSGRMVVLLDITLLIGREFPAAVADNSIQAA